MLTLSLSCRRVVIVLAIEVISRGNEIGEKIGTPVPYKPGQSNTAAQPQALTDKPVTTNQPASQYRCTLA